MKARLYDRLAALVSLVLLVSLALFTYYLAAISDRQQPRPTARAVTHEPDYFVERLALVKLNESGEPAFRLEARSLLHYPDDDTTEFRSPRVVSLDPAKPRVVVVADRGVVVGTGDETRLSGNVVITREATAERPELRATMDHAVVLANDDIVRTDHPVRVVQGGNVLEGVGMELDNRSRQLRVDSRVRATLQPSAASAVPQAGPAAPPPATSR